MRFLFLLRWSGPGKASGEEERTVGRDGWRKGYLLRGRLLPRLDRALPGSSLTSVRSPLPGHRGTHLPFLSTAVRQGSILGL